MTRRPVLNVDDADLRPWGNGDKYEARIGDVSGVLGAEKLGYNVVVLPAGKRAFPMHNHRINEEMFFIIEGEGEVRVDDKRYPIKRGDVVACPPGDPTTAHQIVNTSTNGDLKYLAVSTKYSPDISEYPVSGKISVIAEIHRPENRKPEIVRLLFRGDALTQDYWEGE